MQLEAERVAGERIAREAAERERADCERRARAEAAQREAEHEAVLARLRIEADAAERAETERQAALLRVRLELEAAAQAERERARTQAIELPPPRRAPGWFVAGALGLTALGCVGIGAGLAARSSPAAVASPAAIGGSSQQLQDAQAAQLTALRQRILELTAAAPPPAPVPAQPRAASSRPKPDRTSHATAVKPARKPREFQRPADSADALGTLDRETDDPLEDL